MSCLRYSLFVAKRMHPEMARICIFFRSLLLNIRHYFFFVKGMNPGVISKVGEVTVNNNSPIQDYVHPDDQTQPTCCITCIKLVILLAHLLLVLFRTTVP